MEHLHHFGLTQDPFSNEPDLRYFFESGSHRDAQRRVERGLRQHKGLTLLTGEGGMGKTLLARRILESLEEEVFEAALLVMLPGAADSTGILQRFARKLGCEDPAEDRAALLAQIYEQLAIVREDGRHTVLMIDDAQIMTAEVFSELAGLLNLEYEDKRLLSMLVVGSSEVDTLLQNNSSIIPRVDVRVRLQPLDMPNAEAYLNHRVQFVNGNAEIVPPAAMEALFKFGRGRPRLLNTLADNALFEAYLAGRGAIDASDVERAAADLGIGPDPGATYSQLTMAPVPPAAPSPPPTLTPAPAAAASLSADDLNSDELLAPATMELDQGLEDAVGDFEAAADAVAAPVMPAEDDLFLDESPLDMSGLPEPPVGSAPAAAAFAEITVEEPFSSSVEEDDLAEATLEPATADDIGDFEMAEAEFAPLELGEADQLEDAFVELLDE